MIDSADRVGGLTTTPWDFLISKNQSLFNGFFTRIGATEVVLEWNNPNIISGENNTIQFTVAGSTVVNITIPEQFMTVEQLLDLFCVKCNASTAPGRFVVANSNGLYGMSDTLGFNITIGTVPGGNDALETQLGLQGSGTSFIYPEDADLRSYRYLDFVSSQLTYNQNLKDSTSNLVDQNVLVRWYMSFDTPTPTDAYGFPILMGYEPFVLRRLYNPPKQIAWENNMPIGQLSFQVIGTGLAGGQIIPTFSPLSNWLMTLQISEN
jgi:hypothetical protein